MSAFWPRLRQVFTKKGGFLQHGHLLLHGAILTATASRVQNNRALPRLPRLLPDIPNFQQFSPSCASCWMPWRRHRDKRCSHHTRSCCALLRMSKSSCRGRNMKTESDSNTMMSDLESRGKVAEQRRRVKFVFSVIFARTNRPTPRQGFDVPALLNGSPNLLFSAPSGSI